MADTYTYTARSAENPEQIVTFTLRDSTLSIGLGTPLEQIETVVQATGEGAEGEEAEEAQGSKPRLWLKPLALSLIEQVTRPFRVADVDAWTEQDWLHVRAWIRTGGLRLAPITLIAGRVDNPEAAHAFVAELEERKPAAAGPLGKLMGLMDYWATWLIAGVGMIILLQSWRRKGEEESE